MTILQRRGFLKLLTTVSSIVSIKTLKATAATKDIRHIDDAATTEPRNMSVRQMRRRRVGR
jgi:hypothetical protein